MLVLNYNIEETLECKPRVKECCEPEKTPGMPPTGNSGDCCYEKWTHEFKEIEADYKRSDRIVVYLTKRRDHLQLQRDVWKTWKKELDTVCGCSAKICTQLEILLHHTTRISRNTYQTKRAIHLLYCMVQDFYMQIDLLKKNYDHLVACIRSQNNPAFVAGQGIMVFIEDYGKKLDAVILTRDTLLPLLISAISTANNINKGIGHHGHHYGLHSVLHEWEKVFNCDGHYKVIDDDDDDEDNEEARRGGNDQKKANVYRKIPEGEFTDIGLQPIFKFPICDSKYYHKIKRRHAYDSEECNELQRQIITETKTRDTLKALLDGLTAVMSDPDVDPSKRCATTSK